MLETLSLIITVAVVLYMGWNILFRTLFLSWYHEWETKPEYKRRPIMCHLSMHVGMESTFPWKQCHRCGYKWVD